MQICSVAKCFEYSADEICQQCFELRAVKRDVKKTNIFLNTTIKRVYNLLARSKDKRCLFLPIALETLLDCFLSYHSILRSAFLKTAALLFPSNAFFEKRPCKKSQ